MLASLVATGSIAGAQDATNLDGSYSVRESWTVTIINPYDNVTSKRKGVATGTIQVVDGNFQLINKTGVPGPTDAGISYDGSTYSVYSQPVLLGIGNKGPTFVAVMELSFAMVLVPLGDHADFAGFYQDDAHTAMGGTLSALDGSGTAIDDNGLEFDVSSVAELTPTHGGGGGRGSCDADCQAAQSSAADLQDAAATAAVGTGKTGRKLKALAHKVTRVLSRAEHARPNRQPKAFARVTTELGKLRAAAAQATGKVSPDALDPLEAAIEALAALLP